MMICPPPSQPPVGLCYCGCGFPTALLKYDYPRQGYVKGEYRKYINGHNARGRKRPAEEISKWIRRGVDHWAFGTKASAETRKKQSESHLKLHAGRLGRYNGGHPNQEGRWSSEYKDWRTQIYKRDNYLCQFCECKGRSLNAHHIKPWALYPELRYVLSNGVTLCVDCHKKYYGCKKVTDGDF